MLYFSNPPNKEFFFGAAVGATTAILIIFLFTSATLVWSFNDNINTCLKDANKINNEAQRLQAINNCYVTYPDF